MVEQVSFATDLRADRKTDSTSDGISPGDFRSILPKLIGNRVAMGRVHDCSKYPAGAPAGCSKSPAGVPGPVTLSTRPVRRLL
eukprot:10356965-Alexandrium_andersonii.AAC.1